MGISKQSHSAEKTRKGRPFGLFETSVCRKISENLKGAPFGDKKIEKKSHSAKKEFKGGTL